jgi:hypothetical protein
MVMYNEMEKGKVEGFCTKCTRTSPDIDILSVSTSEILSYSHLNSS